MFALAGEHQFNSPTTASLVQKKEISEEILKGVDYVVNLPIEKSKAQPSTIIKLSNAGMVKIIRE